MPHSGTAPPSDPQQQQRALSRWDNEGGAVPPVSEPMAAADRVPAAKMTDAELAALHVRVIALENLVISLLAAQADPQLDATREMASYISPRPGFTDHALTTRAAAHMIDLVERACRFRGGSG